jgi:transglutaminase-like putative cysteine protease
MFIKGLRSFNTLTALLGALSFIVAEGRPVLLIAALGAALISTLMLRPEKPVVLPRPALNLMVLIATGSVVLRVMARNNEVVSELTEFIVWVLIIKLLDRKIMRDEAQLLGLSAFAVIGAVLTSNTLPLGVTLLLYTPGIVISMVMLQLGLGVERARTAAVDSKPIWPRPATSGAVRLVPAGAASRSLLKLALLSTVMSGALAVGAFIVTPRTLVRDAMGGWGSFGGPQVGFSDSIRLGDSGLLQSSAEPVLDIRLIDSEGQPIRETAQTLYLRGAILDKYDPNTGAWEKYAPADPRRDKENEYSVLAQPGLAAPVVENPTGRLRITQVVTFRRPLESATPLFSLYHPVAVKLDRPSRVDTPRNTGIPLRNGQSGMLGYTVESRPDFTDPNDTWTTPYALAGIENPFRTGRIAEEARRILTEARVPITVEDRIAGDARRAAQAFIDHLRRNFRYSLEMIAPPPGVDPIENFLFTTRAGHCEYFASSMAALCLAVDIPARVVTGYAGGEFNAVAGHFTIRRSDAHAWVELKLNPERWETFDPTPPGDLPHALRAGGGFFGWIKQLYEAVEFSWIENVVTFDQSRTTPGDDARSREWDRSIRSFAQNLLSKVKQLIPQQGIARFVGIFMLIGVLVLLAMVLVALYRRGSELLKRHFGLHRTGAADDLDPRLIQLTRFYSELLAELRKANIVKPRWQTPLAFARSLQHPHHRVGEITLALVERYYLIRFAAHTPGPNHDREVTDLLSELRTILSQRALPSDQPHTSPKP